MSDKSLDEQISEAEERIIRETLESARWNVTEAARVLGINRTQFYRRLHRFGLVRKPRAVDGG